MSEIRNLLARAQEAETKGRKEEAADWLLKAAAWYRDRQMLRRAGQMLRQVRRVQGLDDAPVPDESAFGFDEESQGEAPVSLDPREGLSPPGGLDDDGAEEDAETIIRRDRRTLVEQRTPQVADPALDAWCSFCCRPKDEVGPLVAGPAGAFICSTCGALALRLLGAPAAGPVRPAVEAPVSAPRAPAAPAHELPSQRAARERFARAPARLTLVLGPEGAGKSTWLRTLGVPLEPPLTRLPGQLLVLDVARPLSEDDEARLLAWLDERPAHRAVVAVRAGLPPPVLVLKGEAGDEPLYDTASLGQTVSHLSGRLLARVDAVLGLDAPGEAALEALGAALAQARGVSLPEATLRQLVGLAHRSGRAAHELAALLARIPPGRYGA